MLQAHLAHVRSGQGSFGHFLELYASTYESLLGARLFPGTLNLELPGPWHLPTGSLRLEGADYPGDVSVSIAPCRLFGRRAFVLRTDANARGTGDHPLSLVEIASPLHLRRVYGLRDGSCVPLELPLG